MQENRQSSIIDESTMRKLLSPVNLHQFKTDFDLVIYVITGLEDSFHEWRQEKELKMKELMFEGWKDQKNLLVWGILTIEVLRFCYPNFVLKGERLKEVSDRVSLLYQRLDPNFLDALYQKRLTRFKHPHRRREINLFKKNPKKPPVSWDIDFVLNNDVVNQLLAQKGTDISDEFSMVNSAPFSFKNLVEELVKYAFYDRKKGAEKVKENAERKYQILKRIFNLIEGEGRQLPLKKYQIQSVVQTYWEKMEEEVSGLSLVGVEQLVNYQKRYLKEKKESKG